MKKNQIVFFLAVMSSSAQLLAQGCSDAGVCTIHSIRNNVKSEQEATGRNEIGIGYNFGKGERNISYYTWEIEYNYRFLPSTQLSARLGYSVIDGELASTSGFNDLFVSLSHTLPQKTKWQRSLVVGIKLPFDQADIEKKGIHLPMPYQSSLGTTDLVLGLGLSKNKFGATLAIQQPLRPTNGNQFLPENYTSVPLALRYLPSNRFTRKGDALLRLSYQITTSKSWSLRPSLLSIYHLGNDQYTDLNKIVRSIDRSSGLTANANLFVNFHPGQKAEWELSLSSPFIVRTNRPDGLTRSFVAALNYRFKF